MKEVGIGLYKPEMPTGENAPASLHNIGASPMWHVMTLRRRGGNEAFRNNYMWRGRGSQLKCLRPQEPFHVVNFI